MHLTTSCKAVLYYSNQTFNDTFFKKALKQKFAKIIYVVEKQYEK